MYKLFLCLRYLRSRVIAYLAVAAVGLCVFMVLVTISVMNGFLHKIENAAKGLFGDIVVDTTSQYGLGMYDEFLQAVRSEVPEVRSASPVILSMGMVRVPGQAKYHQPVQIAGIRLPEQASVTDFERGLFVQKASQTASFDPPAAAMLSAVDRDAAAIREVRRREHPGPDTRDLPPEKRDLLARIDTALSFHDGAADILRNAAPFQQEMRRLEEEVRSARAGGRPSAEVQQLEERLEQLAERSGWLPPGRRVILGLGLPGLSFRTDQGDTVRYLLPGHKVVLYTFPMGRQFSATEVPFNPGKFTVVDDCHTDVWSIDSNIVYLPFETLQELNSMGPEYSADEPGKVLSPSRCSQIHMKVADGFSEPRLREVCRKVLRVWASFRAEHPEALGPGAELTVGTWRQRHAKIIAPLEQQRTLVVIMFGVISMVAVLLVLVIFYVIVFQKTKEIGLLKAVGASSAGVAQIFLAYGAAIGLLGSILGTAAGYCFVRNINHVRDLMERSFGFGVWSREWFLFEKIPNEVEPLTALLIVLGAIGAGVVGAMFPAIRAARMQPVESLRYE